VNQPRYIPVVYKESYAHIICTFFRNFLFDLKKKLKRCTLENTNEKRIRETSAIVPYISYTVDVTDILFLFFNFWLLFFSEKSKVKIKTVS
jgi:hypothetical protein